MTKKIIFQNEYSGESIIDAPEDLHYAFADADVPQDEYGIQKGTFILTIEWVADE